MALGLWGVLLAGALTFYFINPDRFSPQRIAAMVREFENQLMLAYLVVSVVRAFFLIPSTPFVLAGGLLFQEQPWLVLAISMLGIALSATLLYGFSDWLNMRAPLERLSSRAFARMETALRGRFAFLYLMLWSFFPLVPTDAACYMAGMVRMNFWKFLAAVCLGELVICGIYVMAGRGLWDLLMG